MECTVIKIAGRQPSDTSAAADPPLPLRRCIWGRDWIPLAWSGLKNIDWRRGLGAECPRGLSRSDLNGPLARRGWPTHLPLASLNNPLAWHGRGPDALSRWLEYIAEVTKDNRTVASTAKEYPATKAPSGVSRYFTLWPSKCPPTLGHSPLIILWRMARLLGPTLGMLASSSSCAVEVFDSEKARVDQRGSGTKSQAFALPGLRRQPVLLE